MKHNKLFMLVVAVSAAIGVCAEIPQDYYSSVESKSGDAILEALHSRIDNHTVISYSGLEPYYEQTDFRGDTVWDMYSTCRFTMADANKSQKAVCDGWNKEHSIPQSWFKEQSPMKSDLFHVYPTDARVNGFRSNNPYGETGSSASGISNDPQHHALGKVGSSNFSGYEGKIYEPDDEYKGDFARTYFYMVARYRDRALNNSQGATVFTASPTNLTNYARDLFLKWHRQDPVSEKEIQRNDAVYGIQHNRNPFIDYPYMVEYIWGSEKGKAVNFTELVSSSDPDFIPGSSDGHVVSTDPVLICNTSVLTFPTLLEGEESTLVLPFQGARLTHDVTLSINGADAAHFGVSPSKIDLATIQQSGKQTVSVTYRPTTNAVHNAILTIASEGANTVQVALSGACAVECHLLWIANCEEVEDEDADVALALGAPITNLPKAQTSCSETSAQFVGWSQTQIEGTTDEVPVDLFSDASEAPVVTGNMTFFAVFARLTQSGGGEAEEIVWTPDDQEGWTNNGLDAKGKYQIFVTDATLSSPVIDYTTLESVTVNMRTYGGKQYNTLEIREENGAVLGKIEAADNTLTDYTWENNADLAGSGRLVFASTTNTSSNGPAIARVTLTIAGVKYSYDQYLTSCGCHYEPEQDIENISIQPQAVKFIHEGQLYIMSGEHIYNIMGQQVK